MNIIELKKHGYSEAQKIDDLINQAIMDHPPHDPNNTWFWLAFCRTVQSSIEIIEATLERTIGGLK